RRDRARLPLDRLVPLPRRGARAAGGVVVRRGGAGRLLRDRGVPLPGSLDAVHPYSSGAPYANWYMGQTFTPDGRTLLFIAPRSAWTMLDDWRGALGLRGSGSHSVRFDHARIPARYALEDMWMVDVNVDRPTPGYL